MTKFSKHTLLLVIRLFIVLVINLATVRKVLSQLGPINFGLLELSNSILTITIGFATVLSLTFQRFYSISYAISDKIELKKIFIANMSIIFGVILLLVLSGETIGIWFVNKNRSALLTGDSENSIIFYHLILLAYVFSVLHIPFSSAIISTNKINVFAAVSIIESALKYGGACILEFSQENRLFYFSFISLLISILVAIFYMMYASKYIEFCTLSAKFELGSAIKILKFSTWSFTGSLAGMGINNGTTILMSYYFGPLMVTSRSIAMNFNLAMNSFISSVLTTVRNLMLENYSLGNHDKVMIIFNLTNKLIFYCMLIMFLPIVLIMDPILNLWISPVSDYTIIFSKLTVIYTFIMALNNPIFILIQAAGRVKEYHLKVEIYTLLIFPVTLWFFYKGFDAQYAYYTSILLTICAHYVRLKSLQTYYPFFMARKYFKQFIVPGFKVLVLGVFVLGPLSSFVYSGKLNIGIFLLAAVIILTIFTWFFGLKNEDKKIIAVQINVIRKLKLTNEPN